MISHTKIKNIYLGTIDNKDKALIRKWRNDYRIRKWCRQNDLLSEACHDRWFENKDNDSSIKIYLILDGDTPVGVCGLSSFDLENQRAEFSIYIAPEYQGEGYGGAALKLLLCHGFNTYPLNIIWGEVFAKNPAMKLFNKIGFKKDGTRREFYFRNGVFIDAHVISIKRSEFIL